MDRSLAMKDRQPRVSSFSSGFQNGLLKFSLNSSLTSASAFFSFVFVMSHSTVTASDKSFEICFDTPRAAGGQTPLTVTCYPKPVNAESASTADGRQETGRDVDVEDLDQP